MTPKAGKFKKVLRRRNKNEEQRQRKQFFFEAGKKGVLSACLSCLYPKRDENDLELEQACMLSHPFMHVSERRKPSSPEGPKNLLPLPNLPLINFPKTCTSEFRIQAGRKLESPRVGEVGPKPRTQNG